MKSRYLSFLGAVVLTACAPSARENGGDATPPNGGGPETTPAACSDGIDNDGDGLIDCADPSCSGIGSCPVCGAVQHGEGSGFPLPDGVGSQKCGPAGGTCPTGQLCYATPMNEDGNAYECRKPYTSTLNFTSFNAGQTMTSINDIQSLCITMEHSYLRDLQIDLVSPSGQAIALDRFEGQSGGEVFLGTANDCDDDNHPVPGIGATYCWTPTATNPDVITFANTHASALDTVTACGTDNDDNHVTGPHAELPPGNYAVSDGWNGLVGATLNGNWTLRIADLWPVDNGYVFTWALTFDPNAVSNCSTPPIQ